MYTANRYPHCLFFLDLVQEEQYRLQLRDKQFVQLAEWQQYRHWLAPAEAAPASAAAPPATVGGGALTLQSTAPA
jgi:hypothetical protein